MFGATTAFAQTNTAADPERLGWDGVTWRNLNPGAGGSVQGISLDPNTPGRLFLASDMEGAYRSDDHGRTWRYIGRDLSNSHVNVISVEPGDSSRVYAGTLRGLEISDNGGENWRAVPGIRDPIGQVLIDPSHPARVLALPGEQFRWGLRPWDHGSDLHGKTGPWGRRNLFLSTDRGETWREVRYAEAEGRRDILSAQAVEAGPRPGLYLGTLTGVFHSSDGGENWAPIASPADSGDCLGTTVSPDGTTLYAAFRVPSDEGLAVTTVSRDRGLDRQGWSHLFAARLDRPDIEWVDLSDIGEGFELSDRPGRSTMYWRPVADPDLAGDRQGVLIGTYRPQFGVWRVDVDWSSDAPAATWRRILWYEMENPDAARQLAWDNGWEIWGITGKEYHFTPESWNDDRLYVTGGQTVFRTDTADPDYAKRWEPIYTRFVREQDGYRFYRTRGQQSVFVFDADALGDYVVQAVADNCLMESYDGGYSWSMRTKPGVRITSRSNSVRILRDLDPPMVLAHIDIGWGANAKGGTLWAKRLATGTPRDEWVALAGGEAELAGLPDREYNPIVGDPHHPGRVYVPTQEDGLYVIDDIEALYAAAVAGTERPRFRRISGEPGTPRQHWFNSQGFAVDPLTPDILWTGERNSRVWRGDRQADGSWGWTVVAERALDGRFAVWRRGDGVALVAARRTDSGDSELVYSGDRGATWTTLLGLADVLPLTDAVWYRDGLNMQVGGLVGDGDRLFFAYTTDRRGGRRALGFFSADLGSDGAVERITDLTEDMPWPYPVAVRIIEREPGVRELYFASRGVGLWRRPLPEPSDSPRTR